MRRRDLLISLGMTAGLLPGCARSEPLRLGFLGGLSGKFADLGTEVRNAVLLGVEDFNASGAFSGGPIELIDRDDGQDADKARVSLRELAGRGVSAVIGPVTSSIGTAVVPLATELGLLLVSPTITTATLSDRDDAFVRVCSDTLTLGRTAARVHARHWGAQRYACIWDSANSDYSVTWTRAYAASASVEKMQLLVEQSMDSRQSPDHDALAERLLSGAPDLVVLCCSSVDAATLIQRLRTRAPTLRIAAAAWAATHRTLELAGRAADGALFEQLYDPLGAQAPYRAFVKAYVERFGQQPTFPGLLGHEATRMVLEALRAGTPRAALKQALVGHEHVGLQGPFRVDAKGDVQRPVHHLMIRDGRFEPTGWVA